MEIDNTQRTPDWRNFPVLFLELEFEMLQPLFLPAFAGSLFRGVMGWSLKDVASTEVYEYLFETQSERSGQADASRPFILLPPSQRRELQAGDRFSLTLKLFGGGTDHVGTFLEAFSKAGERGLGRTRSRFKMTRVISREANRSWVVFDSAMGSRPTYLPLPCALGSYLATEAHEREGVALTFETPTRLIEKGVRVREPSFALILKAALRRMDALLVHHGGLEESLTFDLQLGVADEVVADFGQLRWRDWKRTSNRQKSRHIMGGVSGSVRYSGQFRPEWLQLLKAAEFAHIGKATTFGMGCFRLEGSKA